MRVYHKFAVLVNREFRIIWPQPKPPLRVFGVEPAPVGQKLRRLCYSLAYMEVHILHFYVLGGRDFVTGLGTE